MFIRFTWVLGFVTLVSIGLLVACSGNYSASSDGLLLVPSQGQAIVQSFSFSLNKGGVSTIDSNPTIPGPPDQGFPGSIVIDPAGTFAYVTSVNTPNPTTAPCTKNSVIASYKINSDGSLNIPTSTKLGQNVIPVALAIDSAGKYLFVANSSVCEPNNLQTGAPGTVTVLSVGSGGALTVVDTFPVPATPGGGPANLVALAVTPTAFPKQGSVDQSPPCSLKNPPTSEFLYVADAQNNGVWAFSVDTSSGQLTILSQTSFPTGSVPSGIAVDPCNQWVYVSNQISNNVSAYKICNVVSLPVCPAKDNSLAPIVGSPFPTGNGPGPLVVSPQDNSLYVLDKSATATAGDISGFQISQSNGSLVPFSPASVATGNTPVSIAIRSDNNWLFVTNNGSASGNGSVSQYSVTPATGVLTPSGSTILTYTYPWGLAVK
jgi:6-phosphogluconolactonase (cycloisomerase 2 family)